jgi:hypothetical protein
VILSVALTISILHFQDELEILFYPSLFICKHAKRRGQSICILRQFGPVLKNNSSYISAFLR